MLRILATLYFTIASLCHAGVYDTLEFGDTRAEVTKKLQASTMVEQQLDGDFFGNTALNGAFKCKAKLAGLSYRLYFDWDDEGGLKEITLRSDELNLDQYNRALKEAWAEASTLFTQVYNPPAQAVHYPDTEDFKTHDILMTHIWHKGNAQSILIGPGIIKKKCFLAIRFVNKHIKPVRTR